MAGEKPKTLLLVKPAATAQFAEIAADLDTENGWYLKVVKSKKVHIPDDTAWDFFRGFQPKEGAEGEFDQLVADVTSGPCVIAVVEHLDGGAVEKLLTATEKLKEKYGDNFFCSASSWEALREVNFFFPYVDRLPVTTTFVVCSAPAIADQVKLRCYDESLLVLAETDSLTPEHMAKLPAAVISEFEANETRIGMLVEGNGAVEKVQLILGPNGNGVSAACAPGTLRGTLGQEYSGEFHGAYCSSTDDLAQYEAEQSLLSDAGLVKFQQTLLMVKPDGMENLAEIVSRLESQNFTVLDRKTVQLTEARVEAFYEMLMGPAQYKAAAATLASGVRHLTSGPLAVLVVARTSAVNCLVQLIGPGNPRMAKATHPKSLRALYGRHPQRNAVHGSLTEQSARNEVAFFFPHVQRNPLPDREETQDFLLRKSVSARSNLTEVESGVGFAIEPSLLQFVSQGLVALCQTRPHGDMKNLDALQYLSDWLGENNPNKPQVEEPEVEVPALVQQNAQGVAYTVEEPMDEVAAAQPEVVEIDVGNENTDKYMAEFETPPMVVLAVGGDDILADVANKSSFMHLDVNELVQAEGVSGGRGAVGKEICRKLAGGMEIETRMKLPLLRYQMIENVDVGRFIISGLNTAADLVLFEQEVSEATFVLSVATADSDVLTSPDYIGVQDYYARTGKFRTVADAEDRAQAATNLMLPKVLYLLGASGSGKSAIAENLESEYGFCHINVPQLLKKIAQEPTAKGKAVKASIEAGELVDKAIVCPEIVNQMRGARRFGFTTFALAGFPRSVEQLRFFESQMPCVSDTLMLDYPRADVVELALGQNNGALQQEIVEKKVGAFYGQEMTDVVAAMQKGPCTKVDRVTLNLSMTPAAAWNAVLPLVRPHVTVILGPPSSGIAKSDLSQFSAMFATSNPHMTLLDVDALLDSELERRTEVGVQMANMLSRGQVVPVRLILQSVKAACRWTNSPALVMEKFPRFMDEAELLMKHFTVDRVILAETTPAKALEASGLEASIFNERWNRTLQVATYFASQGLLVKVDLEEAKGKETPAERALAQAVKAGRPKCIAIVGMPFVGKTALANTLKDRCGFTVIGDQQINVDAADPKERARLMVAQIEKQLNAATSSMVVIDGLLTDSEVYAAFEETLGAPAVLNVTASDEALAARASDAVKDSDDTDVQPRIDAAKEALEASTHYLSREPALPNVYKIVTADAGEADKVSLLDAVATDALNLLQPQVHIVAGPMVRDCTSTLASVLAQKAAGKQIVLDGRELAAPNPRYPAALNAALQNAAACGETILPGVWAQVFEQRLAEYPLQHLFLFNYPGTSVDEFPTVRDELEVLGKYAVIKGIILAEFTDEALAKFCFKGAAKTPASAAEAQAFFRGNGVTDAQAYMSAVDKGRDNMDSLNVGRSNWMTPMSIENTDGSLAEAAREASKQVLADLGLA